MHFFFFAGEEESRLVDARRLNELVRKDKSVVGQELDSLEAVVERRKRDQIGAVLNNTSQPLYDVLWQIAGSFSHRQIPLKSKMEHFCLNNCDNRIKGPTSSPTNLNFNTYFQCVKFKQNNLSQSMVWYEDVQMCNMNLNGCLGWRDGSLCAAEAS
ncbi:hypothetical protein PAMP_008468 [Pampus punctatissimus]